MGSVMTTTIHRVGGDDRDCYRWLRQPADAVLIERLLTDGSPEVEAATLARMINKGRDDLAGSPPGAIPELLERLVRQRLNT